jgi:NAD(P)-dependent dehydrogenase (short-subunit alcohol dehydrogenase family)
MHDDWLANILLWQQYRWKLGIHVLIEFLFAVCDVGTGHGTERFTAVGEDPCSVQRYRNFFPFTIPTISGVLIITQEDEDMKIIVIGATGTIGSAIVKAIGNRHEVIPVSLSKSLIKLDIADRTSISRMFETTGRVDAVISAAGLAKFGPMTSLADADFALGLNSKLMGQVNLVRLGLEHVNDNGSFTLTSGILSRKPMNGSTAISLVNSAIEGFARAAKLEMPRGIRINVVSPNWVVDTLKAFNMDPSVGTPAEVVARAYVQVLEGTMNGEVFDAI